MNIPGLAAYWFPWSHWRYYAFTHVCGHYLARAYLRSHGSFATDHFVEHTSAPNTPASTPPSTPPRTATPLESAPAALARAHAA